MFAAKTSRQAIEVRLRLLHGDAGPELRQDVVVFAPANLRRVWSERQRQKDLRVSHDAERRHDLLAQ
jgi:hypothetical protein